MTSLFYKGFKHGLQPEDMYEVLPTQAAKYLSTELEK